MKSGTTPKKIIVVRNDKLGDFTLALPTFELLKRNMPELEVWGLVSEYTRELAELYPAIDRVLVDPADGKALNLARSLRKERFDAVITLISTNRVGAAAMMAGIPCRLAPATKLAQIFYNWRITQRRSRSVKPEFEYNLDLARAFLQRQERCVSDQVDRPVIHTDESAIALRRAALAEQHGIAASSRWLIVHPGHGGSANNLSVQQYQRLIDGIQLGTDLTVVVTSGPGELDKARRLADRLETTTAIVHESTQGLGVFIEVLATAEFFIGGSTGPLHLAGALDVPTAGFYPRRTTSSATRWQTLNRPERRLAFMPPPTAGERDMSAIDIDAAAALIRRRYLATTTSN